MKINFTNAHTKKDKPDSTQIDIENCTITNFDSNDKQRGSKPYDLTIFIGEDSASVKKGKDTPKSSNTVDFNERKYSIFTEIARMYKSKGETDNNVKLTWNDVVQAHKEEGQKILNNTLQKYSQTLKYFGFDDNAQVARIVFVDNNTGKEETLRIDFETKQEKMAKTAQTTTTQNTNEQPVLNQNIKPIASQTDVMNKILKICGKSDPNKLTLNDIKKAKAQFESNKADWENQGITKFGVNPFVGTVSIKLSNGTSISLEYDPTEAELEPYKKYIKAAAKTSGYSEDLISNILLIEKFTPKPVYKNENGGLWEYGFGHTTKEEPSKDFTINEKDAVMLLTEDIKEKEKQIKILCKEYYDYDNLPKSLQEALIDVAYNRGIGKLSPTSKVFDNKYASVHANIMNKDYAYAAIRLRQEKFKVHEAGVRKRSVIRFLDILESLQKEGNTTPKEIVNSMNKFEKDGQYYSKTLSMLPKGDKAFLTKRWNQIYNTAKSSMPLAQAN